MVETRSKKKLISNASKAPAKMTVEELCKQIADHSTRKGEERKSGASDTVCNHLRMFGKDLKATNDIIPMLNDYKKVDDYLSKKPNRRGGTLSINSLKSYYTTLKLAAEVAHADKDAIDFYTKKMNEYAGVSNQAVKENTIPEKFADDGMPNWDDLKDISTQFTSGSKYGQNHMLTAIYTLIPPRRLEYRSLYYLDKKPSKDPMVKPPKDKRDKDSDGIPWNYLYPDGNSYSMVLTDYKTNRQYKVYQTKLPVDLGKVITGYVNKQTITNGDPFFSKQSGSMYSQNEFSKRLSNAIKVKYDKHPLTVDDLRHIYINHLDLNQLSIKEKEDIAMAMGHSWQKQAEYKQVKDKGKRPQVPVEDSDTEERPTPPPRSDGAETSRQAEERGEFDYDDPSHDEPEPSQEPEPEPEPTQASQTNAKEELIRTMKKYYELKIKLLEKKLAMLENVL